MSEVSHLWHDGYKDEVVEVKLSGSPSRSGGRCSSYRARARVDGQVDEAEVGRRGSRSRLDSMLVSHALCYARRPTWSITLTSKSTRKEGHRLPFSLRLSLATSPLSERLGPTGSMSARERDAPLDETAAAADQLLFDDAELDRIFNQEASLVSREAEVMRVLQCFKLNPYEILGLDWMPGAPVSDQDIRKSCPPPPLDHRCAC